MTDYIVRWEIHIDATTSEAAALQAFRIMQDRNTTATLFEVRHPDGTSVTIDTEEIPR